jgi:3-methylfumaryl-CoA hydratase
MNASLDTPRLADWIGNEELAVDALSARDARQLAATLLRLDSAPLIGQELPALWHWCCFAPVADGRDLDVDGHPARGGFLPPVTLPRRMWAGGDVAIHRPPRIGETLHRMSKVTDVKEKRGRSGPLVFVTVRHEICTARGESCISERQDIVYRDAAFGVAAGDAARTDPEMASEDEHWSEAVRPEPVMLFRYSALTFNGHRIHYDREHATRAEGYPGLVVHGPLLATLLAGALERRLPCRPLKRFAFRAVRPAFDGDLVTLCARDDGQGHFTLWARDEVGHLTMSATARA